MRALVLSILLALGTLFWWGIWRDTWLTLEITGAIMVGATTAAVIYERIGDRRRKRDWPTAKLVN